MTRIRRKERKLNVRVARKIAVVRQRRCLGKSEGLKDSNGGGER